MTLSLVVLAVLCGLAVGMAQAPAPGSLPDALSPTAAAPEVVTEQAPAPPPEPTVLPPKCCKDGECEISAIICEGPAVPTASTRSFNVSISTECTGESSHLFVQLWMSEVTEGDLAESGAAPLVVLSQGFVPEVLWTSAAEPPRFFPPLAAEAAPLLATSDGSEPFASASSAASELTPGSFADVTAWLLSRRQHRIIVPLASSPEPYVDPRGRGAKGQQWHLTVANMVSWLHEDDSLGLSIADQQYQLAAACYSNINTVPCPPATVNAIQCARRSQTGNGIAPCETVPGGLGQVRACPCMDGWIGDACMVAARTVTLPGSNDGADGNTGWLQLADLNDGLALEMGQWAHLRVKLQSDQQLVVVEMEQQMGNCMLFAKPRGQGQAPYDIPSILDFNDFADVEAYRDHAVYAARSLLRFGADQRHEIAVAVHNYAHAAIPSEPCQAQLRVRSIPAETGRSLCPFDCSNNRGACLQDWQSLLEGDPEAATAVPTEPTWNNIDDQLRCTCNETPLPIPLGSRSSNYVGRFCEAAFTDVGDSGLAPLQPGRWRAHQFNLDEGDSAPKELTIDLTLGKKIDGAWTEHGNVVFVARLVLPSDTDRVPPTPTQNDLIFQSGSSVGEPKVYTIAADDLVDVQFIIFALYNLDASGSEVDYKLKVQATRQREALSVAVVVAIAISAVVVFLVIIVLFIVIFRQCRARLQDPQVVLQQIGPRAVPPLDPAEIEALETFSFEDLTKKTATATMSARILAPATIDAGGNTGHPPNPAMCRICQEDYTAGDQLVKLPCGHVFHKSCSKKWLGEETATCPVCRLNLLDPAGAPLPSRTAASYTETSFSVPGYLTPAYTDSAPSPMSSDPLEMDGSRAINAQGPVSSDRSLRSAVHSGTAPPGGAATGAAAIAIAAAPNGDSPLSPSRSRSPLYRMFSGPVCLTEPSGDAPSQDELFHTMQAESNLSAILRSVESSAVTGVPSTVVDPGGRAVEHAMEGGTPLYGHAPAPVAAHTVLSDSDVSMVQTHQHLQHVGSPVFVPAPTVPAAAPVATAPGSVIPAPGVAVPNLLSTNHSGSPTCTVGVPGASSAVSMSHSGPSRAISTVSTDFPGLPPVGVGFGGSGGLLSPLPGSSRTPDWVLSSNERGRDHMHEGFLEHMHGHGHAHHRITLDTVAVLPSGPPPAGVGVLPPWRPGQRGPSTGETLPHPLGNAPSQAHLCVATGASGGSLNPFAGTANVFALQEVGNPVDLWRARISDGAGTTSAATVSGLVGRAASEDSLLNSDGGGSVAGDSLIGDGEYLDSARSPRHDNTEQG